jgi:hypothetical protein
MVIDTACSSSMIALDVAITDLRLGKYWKFTFKSKMFWIHNIWKIWTKIN